MSLLLHANDSVAETSHAARDGLAKVIGVVMDDEDHIERFRRHLAISCSNFSFPVFLRYRTSRRTFPIKTGWTNVVTMFYPSLSLLT